ncbi:kinesin-like protein KIF20B isoform X6 [Astatotilapia calliptera]|uniref:kinesin-like protein KIF20B isoform X6 n=1 Tax=Astatotilapia calliptera TaxID=8154 RepID=UPI000E414F1B|nr:kinesin-like protein KIF20B isoform X6 [Astatotilapia calliptera]
MEPFHVRKRKFMKGPNRNKLRMMESCPDKADKQEQVAADVLKGAHLSEVGTLPDSQDSCTEEKEHLQVYLRVRPFTSAETNSGESQDCVTIKLPDTVLLKPPSSSLSARLSTDKAFPQTGQHFQFSQVYGPETTQRELFAGTVKDLVKDVLEGRNSLVFTYGVTNAGKTFTFLGPDSDAGILPRSLDVIFSSINEKVFPGMSIKPHRCREFTRLTVEQQTEEALFKRSLLRQLKESAKSNISLNSTNRTVIEGTSMLWTNAEDEISLEVEANTKFSVWVSFCEIYNENIHDLLEVAPGGALRRTALRLSQDVKGNAFVKDLRWVQVNSAEEAYMVMKLGKKNQSFSSTRLNHLSSRSHSIFSIRILRIEDVGTPRVQTVSELCLCDLAGSERCAKTHNKGERLKEAGNINTSLLILGKCINALRHNQQAKLLQHVPFRESKLTHYLQSFFCGRGKACMIININQCASMYDETLNVLKFSAVAQKVVVLSSKPVPFMPQRSVGEVSFIMNSTESKALRSSRTSSLMGFESSLEDVQEDEDDECEEEESMMMDTTDQAEAEEDGEDKILVCKKTHQRQAVLLNHLQVQLKKARAESLLMESRVREDIGREFSELFSEMQNDYNERLAREREILEERAERRLEIFKNLINKMAAGPSGEAEAVDKFLNSCSSELVGGKKSTDAAQRSADPGRAGPRAGAELEPNEGQQEAPEPLAHKCNARGNENEEKRTVLFELQEMSSEVSRLEKQVGDLQRTAELAQEKSSREKEQLQGALTALQKELRAREEALAVLEGQTLGKEEALASLKEERKKRDEAVAAVRDLKQSNEKMLESLEEERKGKEKAMAALETERRAKEEAMAALAALHEEKSSREEEERKEISRLAEQRRHEEADALRQELGELTVKLETAEHQVTSNAERAEKAFVQLQAAQAQVDEQAKAIQEKCSQIQTLTQEADRLKQEVHTSAVSQGANEKLQEEVSQFQKSLAEERQKTEAKHKEVLDLEHELAEVKQQLAHKQLVLDQQLELSSQKEASSKQEVEELQNKLKQQGEMSQAPLDDLQTQLECQKQDSREEAEELRGKLEQQTAASERQVEQLKERLREQEASSLQQLEELKRRLSEQKSNSSKLVDDLRQKLSEQERAAERLKTEVEDARIHSEAKELKRMNSDLQAEAASLREKVSNMEKQKESCKTEAQPSSSETERMLEEKDSQMEEKLAELQKELLEKDAQVTSLKKSLQEAQEQREEDECQAVQEARRKEVERRRELLAVAHEAIAQKEVELKKRDEDISRLKENAKQDSEKVKSLSVDLQRKEEDSSDLREKLADYKKQMQQVQKEISAMRDEEKVLKQKLSDAEKAKKQLQSDLAGRDRTIQQLKVEQSSHAKSDQTLQRYQQACKELEAKERVMEGMRLALSEQEDTQEQMEQVLEEKLNLIQELSSEVEKLKEMLLQQQGSGNNTHQQLSNSQSDDLKRAKQEAAEAQDSVKISAEKHQADRRKWLEEKVSLIGQAKEAEDKRNQEMRKFAEDRERCTRLQSELESQLAEKEKTMENWRQERDTLVAALEVQLKRLLSSQAEKDKLIQQLQQNNTQPPQEGSDGGPSVATLQAALSEKEAEILRLTEQLKASTVKQEDTVTQQQAGNKESSAALMEKPRSETIVRKSGRKDTRASVSSRVSSGCPSVLESSEISTEEGRMSRFPRPELEISFSPLQPNRMALRRQGEEGAVTVKITRSARKRKSGEMEKEEVEAENRRNTRTKLTPKLTPHREESSSPAGRHDSQISVRSRKEGTLQKIGDFLQSSPTLLGTKAKKMMSLVSGRAGTDAAASSSSLSLRAKKNKRKLYRPEISSPIDMPAHPIISREPEEKESDHQIIKRRLRSRKAK